MPCNVDLCFYFTGFQVSLHYTKVFCAMLSCSVPYCNVLSNAVLYCIEWCCALQFYPVLYQAMCLGLWSGYINRLFSLCDQSGLSRLGWFGPSMFPQPCLPGPAIWEIEMSVLRKSKVNKNTEINMSQGLSLHYLAWESETYWFTFPLARDRWCIFLETLKTNKINKEVVTGKMSFFL